jgi:hypothetical protein
MKGEKLIFSKIQLPIIGIFSDQGGSNMKRSLVIGLGIMLSIASWAPNSRADEWNKKTIVTVYETMQIPGGVVLTPGVYVFRLMDSSSNRNIVQVFNERENRVLATIMAIPKYRVRPSGESEFSFWEMPKDTPPALRSWFYPGDNLGQEFAYPKSEAIQFSDETQREMPFILDEP